MNKNNLPPGVANSDIDNTIEHDELVDCHYHYDGCLGQATTSFEYYASPQAMLPKAYPCCQHCNDIRAAKQKDIDERYMNIESFEGANEFGEYYDEDSY